MIMKVPDHAYVVSAFCMNCRTGLQVPIRVEVPKGDLVGSQPCPSCGCKTLQVHAHGGQF